jgi:alpha,alpha-trehalase
MGDFELLRPVFEHARVLHLHHDDKVFADAILLYDANVIIRKYQEQKNKEDFDFERFFYAHFKWQSAPDDGFVTDVNKSMDEHIKSLWSILSRDDQNTVKENSSRINLPYPYIVPGGRFTEIYYWDSYFTMLGLKVHGAYELIRSIVKNFAWMIETYGHIPNGSRTYYMSRSQPPYFCMMVALLAEIDGEDIYSEYIDVMIQEHQYLTTPQRTPQADKGVVLNRYYDELDTPRVEMYHYDLDLTHGLEDTKIFFRNMRAACESGWDFSSRWFVDAQDILTMRTTEIFPVDLNCLLYQLEINIAKYTRDKQLSNQYSVLADKRKQQIQAYFWDEARGMYMDYHFLSEGRTDIVSVAGVFPLWMGISSQGQADRVALTVENVLLKKGGIVSTEISTSQQWDHPNGWAPLQYATVAALKNYRQDGIAHAIAERFYQTCDRVYRNTGKMMEKYNVVDASLHAGGGEYEVQSGFGWTNGVCAVFGEMIK